jgi:hypothetical protein
MEKIDISELLRDCPKGMELDCTVFENLTFEEIDEVNSRILCNIQGNNGKLGISFNKFGCYSELNQAKCVIFPKGKSTWEGFQRPFIEGDIVFYNNTIAIFKEWGDETLFRSYVIKYLYKDCDTIMRDVPLFGKGVRKEIRFATEEEKAQLFKAIKNNGYRWNPETKKLEKLVESKEDTDDKTVMSGIYFDREYYADEVELHLGNYEIEVRDGKIYAVFKNTSERLIEPKFKVGDKIKHKNTVLTIISVRTNSYLVEDEPNNFGILVFSQQDKWELINEPKFKVGDRIKKKGLDNVYAIEITAVTPRIYTFRSGNFQYVEVIDKDYELVSSKFDISTLKPFDKVLVRDTKEQVWVADLFSHLVNKPLGGYTFACVGHYPSQCIPYEGNEHLLGTTDDCDEYFNLIS